MRDEKFMNACLDVQNVLHEFSKDSHKPYFVIMRNKDGHMYTIRNADTNSMIQLLMSWALEERCGGEAVIVLFGTLINIIANKPELATTLNQILPENEEMLNRILRPPSFWEGLLSGASIFKRRPKKQNPKKKRKTSKARGRTKKR